MESLRSFAKRIGAIRMFRSQICLLWNTYEHLKFAHYVRKNVGDNQWVANINPYILYEVPPEDVKSPTATAFDFLKDTGRVVNGNWDLNRKDLTESIYFKSFRQHFHDGDPWEETPLYDGLLKSVESGEYKRYVSEEDLQAKFELYEKVYNSFLNDNYKLQSELAQSPNWNLPGNGGRALLHSHTKKSLIRHEISVNIARDGELIWNDGRHRLALAALAGVDRVPVRVLVRHQEWQSVRERIVHSANTTAQSQKSGRMVSKHISDEFAQELDDVYQGIEHPDLKILLGEDNSN